MIITSDSLGINQKQDKLIIFFINNAIFIQPAADLFKFPCYLFLFCSILLEIFNRSAI